MKILALFLIFAAPLTGAVVELVPGPTVAVFGGGTRSVDILFRNQSQTNVQLAVNLQLLQASSTTVAPWSESRPWRSVVLQPRQTSIERVEVDFPIVRRESSFLVRFVSGREILGLVPVQVYPGNVLSNLVDVEGPVVFSAVRPDLRRVLIDAGFKLTEAGEPPTSAVRPQLAIYGSEFFGKERIEAAINEAVSRAKAGLGVVLILPDYNDRRITAPSYYPAQLSRGTLVTVREEILARLSTDPLAQLRLARIIRLALGQENLNPLECDL